MSGLEHEVVDVGGGDRVVIVVRSARNDWRRDIRLFQYSRFAFARRAQMIGQLCETSSNEAF